MRERQADRRLWSWVVLLGLTGQLAWTVENMYLNVFVYDTITDSPMALATLVAASALAATVATLLVGAASDRSGRRRELIAGGYVLWGACTAAFGLVSVDAAAALLPMVDAVTVAIAVIILLDCVMSVLGAAANDAAFNAWVTDSTHPGNRGRVDGVLATMPLLAMLLVFGALDPLTRGGHWVLFFSVVGGATAVVGVVAWFGLRETRTPRPSGSYLSSVVHGLRPSTVRAQPRLYLALSAWALLGTSTQVFLPYLIIYVQRYLDIAATMITVVGADGGVQLVNRRACEVLGVEPAPVEPEERPHLGSEDALIAEVVHRHDRRRAAELRRRGRAQQRRDETGLPIVAVKEVGGWVEPRREGDDGVREEREALGVVLDDENPLHRDARTRHCAACGRPASARPGC